MGINPCLCFVQHKHLNAAIHPTITHKNPDYNSLHKQTQCRGAKIGAKTDVIRTKAKRQNQHTMEPRSKWMCVNEEPKAWQQLKLVGVWPYLVWLMVQMSPLLCLNRCCVFLELTQIHTDTHRGGEACQNCPTTDTKAFNMVLPNMFLKDAFSPTDYSGYIFVFSWNCI